jgi:Tol biopolymer transport system component
VRPRLNAEPSDQRKPTVNSTSTHRPRRRRRLAAIGAGLGLALLAGLVPTAPAGAASHREPVTGLASVDRTDGYADAPAVAPSTSDDGRFIAFASVAEDIVLGDTNGRVDIFVRDTLASSTVKVTDSYLGSGHQADGSSGNPRISGNGRYVVFESLATNLVALDTNGKRDVFRHDLVTGITRRVSVPSGGGEHYADSRNADISDDGTWVVFEADGNLVAGDANDRPDVFAHHVSTQTTERISVTTGEVGLLDGYRPAISGDARYVAFETFADPSGFGDGRKDIFLRDRANGGSTEQISIEPPGSPADGHSSAPSISEDGDVIAFETEATNLNPAQGILDTNGVSDIIVRRRSTATTTRASVGPNGTERAYAATGAQLDDAGTRVQFISRSPFTNTDSNDQPDVFVRDLTNGVTVKTSVSTFGDQVYGANLTTTDLSGDGKVSVWSWGIGNHPHASVWFRGTFETGPYDSPIDMMRRLHQAFETPLTVSQEGPIHSRLRTGTWSSEHLIVDVLAHGTFDDIRGPVTRLYWAYFERRPEQAGLDFWVAQRKGGRSLASISQFFSTSPEFKTLYGNTSNSTFITLVYQNVLDRNPDAQGLAYWKNQLDQGLFTRGGMMIGFSESPEGRLLMRGEVDTILLHVGLLGSVPDAAEFAAGVELLELGAGQVSEVLAHQLLVSPELAAHVG